MRVVITGATGNVGTSLLARLSQDPDVRDVVGIARRLPGASFPRTRFVRADVARDPLEELFRGADAVVHLAWRQQPSHEPVSLERTNVDGSGRVFDAASRAGVRALLYASSVGTYAEGPKDRRVDESWSTAGIETATYSQQKARVETMLDGVEQSAPWMRVVRFRPGFIFKRDAASDIRRLFLGPLVPRWVFGRRALRIIPDHPRLRFQAVHSLDVGEAFRLALHRDVRGAFNLAADPVLEPRILAEIFDARRLPVSRAVMRGATNWSWHMRLQPSEAGWVDLALGVPLMEVRRATEELGWGPQSSSSQALLELVDGLRRGAGIDTPPLASRRGLRRLQRPDPEAHLLGTSA